PEDDNKGGKGDELSQRMSGGTCADVEPDTSPAPHTRDPMDAYKRAAPQIINELGLLLSQHRWAEEGRFPHGIVNILNYSWQDLTAGAVRTKSPEQADGGRGRSKGPLKVDDARMGGKVEAGEKDLCVVEGVAPSRRKPQVSSNPGLKKRKHKPNRDSIKGDCKSPGDTPTDIFPPQQLTSPRLSVSPCHQTAAKVQVRLEGWIIQQKQPPCDEAQPISLCQKLQTADQCLNKPLILRHYGEAKAKLKDRRVQKKAQPATLVNGMPQIPETKQQDPTQQKLHYRIDDGSSFIYYLSGCMAVSQSHSGLPCGGFYTNVFSDGECPVILATMTAFGRGTVTHPLSSATTAVWDQDGGFICDHNGKIIKTWSWQTGRTPREKIVIQVQPQCRNIMMYSKVSGRSQDVLQMVREVDGVEEPSTQWRRGGQAGRELKSLQWRVQTTLDNWLDYYRVAIGIKCPAMQRMSDAPLRTSLKRELQAASLPSLNSPERADAKPVHPVEGRNELQEPHRHLLTPAERPLDCYVKLPPRTPKKRTKEEPRVTQIGPLQIHGNFQLESVIIPNSPDLQPSAVARCPAPPSFTPSAPLTVCPPLLKAALLGEGGHRRCCCSATLMPVLTDLCQMDSFRLVRYEMSTTKPSCGEENILLQQRHNAAPGMVLMYIRGKLLFVGYIFSGRSCSVRDLQKQISSTRRDYRLGLSLTSDYKFSNTVNAPAAADTHSSQDVTLKGGDDTIPCASAENQKANEKYV
ncbi:hypothetical protein L3Q82_023797, partial [Scortum barcoo]